MFQYFSFLQNIDSNNFTRLYSSLSTHETSKEGHSTHTPYVDTNIKSEMRSFKSNENIHKKEGGSYYVVSANKASSVTL